MKKLFTCTLVLILLSCSKEQTPDYTIISGKFTGSEQETFTVTGISFEKEITIDEDRSFIDTLHIDYNGAYRIGKVVIYLHKGKNLTFEADAKKLEDIIFSGDLAAENNYIAEKSRTSNKILGTDTQKLYSLSETEFAEKVNQLTATHNELLAKNAFVIQDFEENQRKDITYNQALLINNYPIYHRRITRNEEFKVSDNFLKIEQEIDTDNSD